VSTNTSTAQKKRPARTPKVNRLGLDRNQYKGSPSTLCKGCGHDSISARIINASWELGIDQTQTIKMSGIGCSSKTPPYFLGQSHGFANQGLTAISISGDGDTASIGIGQFKHAMRRNVPMVYIIENNGVYGLTKGQFSATADLDQELKYAGVNELPPLDVCQEALIANATFVARSFAGDTKQVEALLKAALSHRGIALLDIISPCVTFNNHDSSTKSYGWSKEHEVALHDLSFVPSHEEIKIDEYDDELEVQLHDGSWIVLKQLEANYDPTNRMNAYTVLEEARQKQQFLTGLFYIDNSVPNMLEKLNMVDESLASLSDARLRPSREALAQVMAGL